MMHGQQNVKKLCSIRMDGQTHTHTHTHTQMDRRDEGNSRFSQFCEKRLESILNKEVL